VFDVEDCMGSEGKELRTRFEEWNQAIGGYPKGSTFDQFKLDTDEQTFGALPMSRTLRLY